jgi:protein gp37
MGDNSKIGWTTHTFNPWWGCTAVSAACDNCYAEAFAKRLGRDLWGKGKERWRTGPANWRKPLAWDREAARTGERTFVFCASMADIFDAEVPDAWRDEVFDLIRRTPHLTWQLLTKRPKVAAAYLAGVEPMPNVMIGATVENEAMAWARLPHLNKVAREGWCTFVSYEPALGPLHWEAWMADAEGISGDAIQWLIIGGESGPEARPFDMQLAFDAVAACRAHGVPVFMKQLGSRPLAPGGDTPTLYPISDKKGERIEDFPEALQIREFPA